MKYHKIVHSDKKDLPCPMCDKMFKTKNSVQKHLKTHDESENLPCTVEGCQFILRNKIALVRHLLGLFKKVRSFKFLSITFLSVKNFSSLQQRIRMRSL